MELLKIDILVIIVLFSIKRVMCVDIKNYIFVVINGVGNMVLVFVELIVNCELIFIKLDCLLFFYRMEKNGIKILYYWLVFF